MRRPMKKERPVTVPQPTAVEAKLQPASSWRKLTIGCQDVPEQKAAVASHNPVVISDGSELDLPVNAALPTE
eukprot:458005-Pleurochrysis_carterae.AAC.2